MCRGRFGRYGLILTAAVILALSSVSAEGRSARAHASAPVRVTLEPGVSLALSSDWYACDRDVNDHLHAKALPGAIAAIVCTPPRDGQTPIHLVNLLVRAPVSLLVDRDVFPNVSAEVLAQATPEMLAALDQFECSHIGEFLRVAPQSVGGCDATIADVSQHRALLIRTSISTASHGVHALRLYLIPYDQGELLLQFECPAADAEASGSQIDSVVASAEIEPGALMVQTVTLSPAPGISLAVPAGWMACDDATNALLGNRPDPLGKRQQSCATSTATPDEHLLVFNPQPLQNVTIGIQYKAEKEITESQLADLSADKLTERTPKICDSLIKPLGRVVDSCVVTVEQIAGHQALVATIVGAFLNDDPTARARNRIYFVPYDQGNATLQFIVPVVGESVGQPLVDAVVKSLVIGSINKS